MLRVMQLRDLGVGGEHDAADDGDDGPVAARRVLLQHQHRLQQHCTCWHRSLHERHFPELRQRGSTDPRMCKKASGFVRTKRAEP